MSLTATFPAVQKRIEDLEGELTEVLTAMKGYLEEFGLTKADN